MADSTSDVFQVDLFHEKKKLGKVRFYRYLDQFPAGPDELKLYRADPLREEHLQQSTLVTCRECAKRRPALQRHVPKLHHMTLQEYLEKWNYPPICAQSVADEARKRKKEWGAEHGGNYFGGKRHELKRSERRRYKPPTPEMRRRWMRLSEQYAGKPRLSTRSKKRSADDATIVELRLAGKKHSEIGAAVGLTGGAVWHVLEHHGLPSGRPCRFLHGEPLAKKHFEDLCNDFGTTMALIAQSVGENPDYEVKRKGGAYFGSKIHHPSGKPRTYYNCLSNCLSRRKPEDVLPLRFADAVLDLRKRWIKVVCFHSGAGKEVREFLPSEIRDLPRLSELLRGPLIGLRTWLRAQSGSVQSHDILKWICDQSREEVAGKKAGRGFRALMFLWPALKDVNQKRPDLLAGRRFIGEVVDELLSRDYIAAPGRMNLAASGKLTALDPRTLSQAITVALAMPPHGEPRKSMGRPRKDAIRKRIKRLKAAGKSWRQIQIQLNAESGNTLTVDAYRKLVGRKPPIPAVIP